MDENENNVQGQHTTAGGDNSVENADYEALYKSAQNQILELTAERDSLKNENAGLKETAEKLTVDAAKVRETNYTLSRQLDLTQAKQATPEEILGAMFNLKGA